MLRDAYKRRNALGVRLLLAAWTCLLLWQGPARAQNQPSPQEEELRRQLQIERAARKALTYQADMRKAAGLAESEEWSSLLALLDGYRPAAGETDQRSWEWHFLRSLAMKKQLVDRQESTFQGPSAGIHHLAWSGNGERLAAVGEDGEALLWDTKTGKELRTLGGRVRWVSWDRDGNRLTISSQNGTVSLWPAEPGPSRRFFGPVEGLYDFRQPAFSPDGQMVALAADEASVVINNAVTGLELRRLKGHQGNVSVVAWGDKGQRLATGSSDGTIKIWDAANGNEIATLNTGGHVFGLQWSADGRQIAAVIWPKQGSRHVAIWDVARRERVFLALNPGSTYQPNQRQAELLLSADGKRIAAESMEGIRVWETATSRSIFQARTGPRFSQLAGCDPEVRRWASLETVGTRATCRVVDMETMDELMRVELEIPMNRYQAALAWSPDGRRLAAGFSQGKVYVFSVPKDRSESRIINAGTAASFDWSPDGQRFAFSSGAEFRIGSLPSTKPPIRLGPPLLLPEVVRLSPDGKYLAGADRDGTLPIWEVASGQITQRLPGHPAPLTDQPGAASPAVHALLWSPDAKRLASLRTSDGSVRVWDVKAGSLQTAFQYGGREIPMLLNDALPLAWSPDGSFLSVRAGWPDRKVRILDVAAGKQTREWDGGADAGSSNAMAWDPTNQKLATCMGNAPRIKIRNVNTGQTLVLEDQVSTVRGLSWSPDGRRLAYMLQDGWQWQIHDLTTRQTRPVDGKGEILVWKPDGSQIALVGSATTSVGVLGFYDAATGRAVPGDRGFARPDPAAMGLPVGTNDGYNLRVQSVVWNEQGIQAAGDAMPYPGAGLLVVWDLRTGKPLLKLGQIYSALADRARVFRTVAWAPDGQSLATLAGDSVDNSRIDIWDAATGQKKQTLKGAKLSSRGAVALAWSPDGRSLACSAEATQVWKLGFPWLPLTLKRSRKAESEADQTFLAWSADNKNLASLECRHSSTHEAVLTAWDLETGQERLIWTRPYEFAYLLAPLAWSPDSKRLAWGGPTPAVWNAASGKEEYPLAGHSTAVVDVQWSSDGRRVLSRSEVFLFSTRHFELKVREAETGQEVLMLRGPMAGWLVAPGFQALASPPGRGSDPGDVIVWDLGARN
jgi:WD40 repeat protein